MNQRGGNYATEGRRVVAEAILPMQGKDGSWEGTGGEEKQGGKVYATSHGHPQPRGEKPLPARSTSGRSGTRAARSIRTGRMLPTPDHGKHGSVRIMGADCRPPTQTGSAAGRRRRRRRPKGRRWWCGCSAAYPPRSPSARDASGSTISLRRSLKSRERGRK